jgi:hypothetical protein
VDDALSARDDQLQAGDHGVRVHHNLLVTEDEELPVFLDDQVVLREVLQAELIGDAGKRIAVLDLIDTVLFADAVAAVARELERVASNASFEARLDARLSA